ncbi:hypothetical protein [Haloferula rosea]|nr:hypothetical protein [Haloferula rosea]
MKFFTIAIASLWGILGVGFGQEDNVESDGSQTVRVGIKEISANSSDFERERLQVEGILSVVSGVSYLFDSRESIQEGFMRSALKVEFDGSVGVLRKSSSYLFEGVFTADRNEKSLGVLRVDRVIENRNSVKARKAAVVEDLVALEERLSRGEEVPRDELLHVTSSALELLRMPLD